MANYNECRACAMSGVGACDDFPDCQPKEPEFKYGDPVTVLNTEGDPSFVGIYVGTSEGDFVLVQHGDPNMDDPVTIKSVCVEAGWDRLVQPGVEF